MNGPHIHRGSSVPKTFLQKIVALMGPLFFVIFITRGNALLSLVISLLGVSTAEWLGSYLLKTQSRIGHLESLYVAILLVVLMPAAVHPAHLFVAAFFMILLGREIFGGIGQEPLPVMILPCLCLFPWIRLIDFGSLPLGIGAFVIAAISSALLIRNKRLHFLEYAIYVVMILIPFLFLNHPINFTELYIAIIAAQFIFSDFSFKQESGLLGWSKALLCGAITIGMSLTLELHQAALFSFLTVSIFLECFEKNNPKLRIS